MKSYILLFLFGASKFLVAPFIGVNGIGLSFLETFIAVTLGGLVGTTFFYFLGNRINKYTQQRRKKKNLALIMAGKPLPRIMTRTNKLIIKAKSIFGIWGIAFLTPLLLSIPIGSIISAKFYHHNRSTILILFFFVILHGLILTSIASYFPSIGQ